MKSALLGREGNCYENVSADPNCRLSICMLKWPVMIHVM